MRFANNILNENLVQDTESGLWVEDKITDEQVVALRERSK